MPAFYTDSLYIKAAYLHFKHFILLQMGLKCRIPEYRNKKMLLILQFSFQNSVLIFGTLPP